MTSKINIADLKKSIVAAEAIAQQLVQDKYHGQSQFVAGLRGNLSAAASLVDEHEKWTVANPEPVAPAAK